MKRPEYVTEERIHHFIREALREDLGDGDYSTLGSVPADKQDRAKLLIKEDTVLAGVELAQEIYKFFDDSLKVNVLINDGEKVKKGDVAFTVEGSARSILMTERLILNCMQRMSGIATYSREMADLVKGTNAKILDTRKTTPNFRMCEKWAVYIGGSQNHRFGLFDMVMLKDNHNDYAGGITKSVASVVNYLKENRLDLKIEVETRNLEEVKEALDTKAVDIIMLDNMSLDMMREAVQLIGNAAKTEASGGITRKTVCAVAETGVDFISSGSVIYGATPKDMSLKAY
ncbi:carboxylating nicotinate-nucleotide diphosphorylase [Dysgonomonas sp. 520]|uniref:carboxylating nicotinate-nucleotide diphosphorylase n=1 Tax=Dysgonomonas sp. 520 TaxID=2302931 RepID=UPI0013CF5E93|nr:carboxylating nicotinate-nucleotide diphosphorylase [Dysgonomonas sp. 520]NDW11119.1 carboxylating nicotinate-nucleotide diphosphorylase [Dysgonomonas sp. 520]